MKNNKIQISIKVSCIYAMQNENYLTGKYTNTV